MPRADETENKGSADPSKKTRATTSSEERAEVRTPTTRPTEMRAVGERMHRTGMSPTSSRLPYLISTRFIPGIQFIPFETVEENVRNTPDVEVIEVLTPRGVRAGTTGSEAPGAQRVIVARMPQERAVMLQRQFGPQLLIERDAPLTYFTNVAPVFSDPGIAVRPATDFNLRFRVVENETPVPRAQVFVFGSIFPAYGITGDDGRVEINVPGETVDTIRGVFVKPESDHWNLVISNPGLESEEENTVSVLPLRDAMQRSFSQGPMQGWGARLMKLNQLPLHFRGRGVKIAVIDSGVAAEHDALRRQANRGFDFTNKDSGQQSWRQDPVGHGTHCAGVIAGESEDRSGMSIRGIVPEAEIIACKVFPGGRFSHLLNALDYCIEQQVDIAVLNLGGVEPSMLVEEKLIRARQSGIACIVAAGDSGGPVQYPGTSPSVLTVAAIGRMGEFPPNSYHAQTVSGRITPDGCFSPTFSAFGPSVAVCAPGVAVISCVPPNNYVALDGTSAAVCHVAGLAALILAHHPDFQNSPMSQVRSSQRVDLLFEIIRQSAVPIDVGNILRTGLGVPDAARAFSMSASAVATLASSFGVMTPTLAGMSATAGLGSIPPGPLSALAPPIQFPMARALNWPLRFVA